MPQGPLARATPASPDWGLDIRTRPADLRQALLAEAEKGLLGEQKELSPKWFYDAKGSALFDVITTLPEYYPTRRERELLQRHARSISQRARPETLVELGAGSAEKTKVLIEALVQVGSLKTYMPFDVSEAALRAAVPGIAQGYPEVMVQAVVGDFDHPLGPFPQSERILVAFLGGTIGNFKPAQRRAFLRRVAAEMSSGDSLLLGTDLVKDPHRLEAAYNDARGVTAEFNLNVLRVLNRELGANFHLDRFRHVARFDSTERWIEMLLCSTQRQTVELPALNARVEFASGEALRTEVSAKFDAPQVEAELGAAGFELCGWWTDEDGDYALSLSIFRGRH